jgi:hypothetical protein
MTRSNAHRRTISRREPCVPGSHRGKPGQDHVFVPSGETKRYLRKLHGCLSGGSHAACSTCGWPADEHPAVVPQRQRRTP